MLDERSYTRFTDIVSTDISEDGLQQLLFKVPYEAKKYGIEMSREKSKSMTIPKNSVRCRSILELEGSENELSKRVAQFNEQVTQFKCIEITITRSNDLNLENYEATCMPRGIFNSRMKTKHV